MTLGHGALVEPQATVMAIDTAPNLLPGVVIVLGYLSKERLDSLTHVHRVRTVDESPRYSVTWSLQE